MLTEKEIENLSTEDKLKLLKLIFDNLDIVLTAAYGASGRVDTDRINIATEDSGNIIKGETIVIDTGIITG